MTIYRVQIGSINGGQNNYKIKASNAKRAKITALKRHAELGRTIKPTDKVYVSTLYEEA